MTKERAAKARKSAWSPEARRKRELTMQRKRAAKEGTEVTGDELNAMAEAMAPIPAKRGRKPKIVTGTNPVAIQLLEMAIKLLKEG
jgi:hypothetical protein